jgi:hypothetical protein
MIKKEEQQKQTIKFSDLDPILKIPIMFTYGILVLWILSFLFAFFTTLAG